MLLMRCLIMNVYRRVNSDYVIELEWISIKSLFGVLSAT